MGNRFHLIIIVLNEQQSYRGCEHAGGLNSSRETGILQAMSQQHAAAIQEGGIWNA